MSEIIIETAKLDEFKKIGQLMVEVYSKLKGFPDEKQQPEYYKMLANIGEMTKSPGVELIVAKTKSKQLIGGVVYFSNMKFYGSGGIATTINNASGIRLLAVLSTAQGKGVGRALTNACIIKARSKNHSQVILHTTEFMQAAWHLYETMGFIPSPELDFTQQQLPVSGFRLKL